MNQMHSLHCSINFRSVYYIYIQTPDYIDTLIVFRGYIKPIIVDASNYPEANSICYIQ